MLLCVHWTTGKYQPNLDCSGDIFHDCNPCERRGICLKCCLDCAHQQPITIRLNYREV